MYDYKNYLKDIYSPEEIQIIENRKDKNILYEPRLQILLNKIELLEKYPKLDNRILYFLQEDIGIDLLEFQYIVDGVNKNKDNIYIRVRNKLKDSIDFEYVKEPLFLVP